ncbi:hypothetical protein IMSAGC005_03911 [Lachnospiraceae bacterium]|nr:hypothetical protein IMSAGC005_03911 [Lachnospiraceae bacterium]
MGFSIKQKNNLCTGIKLAAELESSEANLRKFITVHGYVYDEFGKRKKMKNILNANISNQIFFELYCYEIPVEYYINKWDVTEDDLLNAVCKNDIKGIQELEMELQNYIQDFSVLEPEWCCDSLL